MTPGRLAKPLTRLNTSGRHFVVSIGTNILSGFMMQCAAKELVVIIKT